MTNNNSNDSENPLNLDKASEATAPLNNPYPTNHAPPAYDNSQTIGQPSPNHNYYPPMEKSMALTYVLWFFVPWTGIHKFYLGKIKTGIAWIILGGIIPTISYFILILTTASMPSEHTQRNYPSENYETQLALWGFAFILLIIWSFGLFVWWVIDACLIPTDIEKSNQALRGKYPIHHNPMYQNSYINPYFQPTQNFGYPANNQSSQQDNQQQ